MNRLLVLLLPLMYIWPSDALIERILAAPSFNESFEAGIDELSRNVDPGTMAKLMAIHESRQLTIWQSLSIMQCLVPYREQLPSQFIDSIIQLETVDQQRYINGLSMLLSGARLSSVQANQVLDDFSLVDHHLAHCQANVARGIILGEVVSAEVKQIAERSIVHYRAIALANPEETGSSGILLIAQDPIIKAGLPGALDVSLALLRDWRDRLASGKLLGRRSRQAVTPDDVFGLINNKGGSELFNSDEDLLIKIERAILWIQQNPE